MIATRPLDARDRPELVDILHQAFTAAEVACALELIDIASTHASADYQALVAEDRARVLGYVCYGPTPMTEGTFDLYWIATHADARGRGVGAALVSAMERELRERRARLVRVETSSVESYGATRRFYSKMQYLEAARLRDFYKEGDDLLILMKTL